MDSTCVCGHSKRRTNPTRRRAVPVWHRCGPEPSGAWKTPQTARSCPFRKTFERSRPCRFRSTMRFVLAVGAVRCRARVVPVWSPRTGGRRGGGRGRRARNPLPGCTGPDCLERGRPAAGGDPSSDGTFIGSGRATRWSSSAWPTGRFPRRTRNLAADHVVPLARVARPSGPLRVVCRRSNSRRGAHDSSPEGALMGLEAQDARRRRRELERQVAG